MIMVLVLTVIIKIIHVGVDQKSVRATLLDLSQDGELKKEKK